MYERNKTGMAEYADILANHNYNLIKEDDTWKVIRNVELLIKENQLEASRENVESLTKEKNKAIENLEEAQRLAHIGSWDLDITRDEVYWSDECYRIYGFQPQSFKPATSQFLEYIHPEDREKVRKAVDAALSRGLPYKIGFRIVKPDGSIRHAYTKGLVYFANGKPVRLYGTVQDITKRRLAEEETNHYIEFERTVMRLARDFINCPLDRMDSVILQSMEMICKYYNADRATVFGYDWENQSSIRLYKWTNNPQRFDDSQKVYSFEGLRDVITCHEKGIPYRSDNISDVSMNSPYHKTAVKSNTQSVISIPLMYDGQAMGAFTISSSIEQTKWQAISTATIDIFAQMLVAVLNRRNREKALQDAHECNRLMLDSTNDGIALYDREDRILNINDTFTNRYGMDKEAVIGMHAKDLLPEEKYADLRASRKRYLEEVFDTGKPIRFEDTKDGMTYDNRFYPVFKDGKVYAVNLFSTDITDKKRAEEEARAKAEYEAKLKITTDFFTNVSH
jgi:PAS domain S-box-containing protein